MSQDPQELRWVELMRAGDDALATGALDRAAELYAAAAALARDAGAPEALGTSLHRAAVARDRQGRHDEAAWLAGQALHMDEQALGPVHPAVARDLHALGLASLGQGKASEAAALLDRSASISRRLSSPRELLLTLLSLGRAHARTASIDDARAAFSDALQLADQVEGATGAALRALHGLAELDVHAGKLAEAHATWVAATRRGAGPEAQVQWRPELANAWLGLGQLAENGRQDNEDAIWMYSLVLRSLGPLRSTTGARALAQLDRLGAAPQLLPDAVMPPDQFIVVHWQAGSARGDIAHPFGGRHTFEAAAAPDGLRVGHRVQVHVRDGALAQLDIVPDSQG